MERGDEGTRGEGKPWVLFFSLRFTQKDGASPLAESPPVTFPRDQHARPLLDPSRSRPDSSSTSDYLSLSNLWLTLCPLLPPSTHSFFKLLLLSPPPCSGPLSPSSSPRRYAAVMNGICGIFGSEMCYCVIVFFFFIHLGLFSTRFPRLRSRLDESVRATFWKAS